MQILFIKLELKDLISVEKVATEIITRRRNNDLFILDQKGKMAFKRWRSNRNCFSCFKMYRRSSF